MTAVIPRTSNPVGDVLEWLESGPGHGLLGLGLTPSVRVEDFADDGTYILRAELPGIDPDKDVQVTVDNGMLTIRGERREESKDKNRHEFHYGSFSRTVRLPSQVDPQDVKATYTDGVLEVRFPIEEATSQQHRVPVLRPD